MNNNINSEIKLSTEVISSIAEIAIQELEGVHLPNFFTAKKLLKNNPIETTLENEEVEITIPIIVDYGVVIPKISPIIQASIKENIEIMTSLKVSKIHLSVVGVNANNA